MNNVETNPEARDNLQDLLESDRKNIVNNITSAIYPSSKIGLLDTAKMVIEEIDQEISKLDC